MFRRRRFEQEMEAELAQHLACRAADLEAAGLDPTEARRRARIEFGAADKFREEARTAAGAIWLETILQDVRFGLRLLRQSPGVTAAAVLMLALGVGATTAIFGMADWLLWRPLPVAQADQLTYLASAGNSGGFGNGFSYPNFADIRAQSTAAFSDMAGALPFQMDGFAADGVTQTIWTSYVSGNFFSLLGVRPALGRLIQPGEGRTTGADPEVVLSYAFWQARFGGRRDVLGREVAVNGRPVRVIGVAARGFDGVFAIMRTDAYLPFSMITGGELGTSTDFFHDRNGDDGVIVIGRRRAGVALAQTQPLLQTIGQRLARQFPKADPWHGLYARQMSSEPPGAGASGGDDPLVLVSTLFLALAGFVLLLACINIANLLLARGAARGREMAVRAALGAGRGRLLRQMLVESLLLAGLGGGGGLLVAWAACRGFNALPLGMAVPINVNIGLNGRVFIFAAVVAVATGIAVGLVPALRASRQSPEAALHGGFAATVRTRLRSTLVALEIAGSAVLLIVAGLFTRSLVQAQSMDLGFNPAQVLNLTLDPHDAGYAPVRGAAFYQELLVRAQALPGAASASLAAAVPFGALNYTSQVALTPTPTTQPWRERAVGYNSVTTEYFATMGIHLLQGREFGPGDDAGAPRVAIISAAMQHRYWPAGGALGRDFFTPDNSSHPVRVVGIVADARSESLTGAIAPFFYVPLPQCYRSPVTLQLRARAADPTALAPAARAVIAKLGPDVPVYDVHTMARAMESLNGYFIFRLGAGLAMIMGTLGLLLAVIGIYGVVAYATSLRAREIALRQVLGADRARLTRLLLRQGLLVTLAGLGLGLLLAAGASAGLGSLLVGVSARDPLTYLTAAGLLGTVALVATLLPVLRALRADPATTLRCE